MIVYLDQSFIFVLFFSLRSLHFKGVILTTKPLYPCPSVAPEQFLFMFCLPSFLLCDTLPNVLFPSWSIPVFLVDIFLLIWCSEPCFFQFLSWNLNLHWLRAAALFKNLCRKEYFYIEVFIFIYCRSYLAEFSNSFRVTLDRLRLFLCCFVLKIGFGVDLEAVPEAETCFTVLTPNVVMFIFPLSLQ